MDSTLGGWEGGYIKDQRWAPFLFALMIDSSADDVRQEAPQTMVSTPVEDGAQTDKVWTEQDWRSPRVHTILTTFV